MPDFGNTSIFSQTDASNNSGTMPGWNGAFSPSTLDNAGQGLQGAVTRQWYWSNYTITTTGSGVAYIVTYAESPAALYMGQTFKIKAHAASTGAATLNVNALGALAIKREANGTLVDILSGDIAIGQYIELIYNGSVFVWTNWKTIVTPATTTEVLAGTGTASFVTPDALAATYEQGASIASAATLVIPEGGYFTVTGTTTITAITLAGSLAGRQFTLLHTGSQTITGGASLQVPQGGLSLVVGDVTNWRLESGGVVRCIGVSRVSGKPVANPDALSTATGTAPSYSIRAWVNFNGATGAIRSSGNVTSITRNAAGDYTLNFTTAMPDADYSVSGMSRRDGSADTNFTITLHPIAAPPLTTTTCRIATGVANSGAFSDSNYITVMIVR